MRAVRQSSDTPDTPPPLEGRGIRVLAAEDNPVFQSMLRAMLAKWGYDPIIATDGTEAWRVLDSENPPRLAILDWMMPGMDGVEICRRVRASTREDYIYIMMLTARSESQDVVEAMEAGADDYLSKPFVAHELRVRLRAGRRILEKMGYGQVELQPIQFYSCFISYSSSDEEFAKRLNHDLRRRGVTCWYAPEDLRTGDKFRLKIDESIRLHDKLLLILSESSIGSRWVSSEVETALEEEHRRIVTVSEALRGNTTVLFPIRIDEAALITADGWAAELRRARHIGDFRNWKEPARYDAAFSRLMRDLAASDELDKRAREVRQRMITFDKSMSSRDSGEA